VEALATLSTGDLLPRVQLTSSYLSVGQILLFFLKIKMFTPSTSKFMSIFYGRSRLDATILAEIISKITANFELKIFQTNSFLNFLKFLSPLKN
jgi:hypothetical protein